MSPGSYGGPVVSSATIQGAIPPYPLLLGPIGCTCHPSLCPPPPPGNGPWCADVVSAEQSSVGLANVLIYCVETGGWNETGGCAQGCRVTFYFEVYQLYHFTNIPNEYIYCGGGTDTYNAGVGLVAGYPGLSPSECTTIVLMIPGA